MEERRRLLLLASDSTGIETDRYDYEVRPVKKNKKFELIRVKQYLKWHVIAVLDHLVILSVRTTNKNTHDSPGTQNNVKQTEEIWN